MYTVPSEKIMYNCVTYYMVKCVIIISEEIKSRDIIELVMAQQIT